MLRDRHGVSTTICIVYIYLINPNLNNPTFCHGFILTYIELLGIIYISYFPANVIYLMELKFVIGWLHSFGIISISIKVSILFFKYFNYLTIFIYSRDKSKLYWQPWSWVKIHWKHCCRKIGSLFSMNIYNHYLIFIIIIYGYGKASIKIIFVTEEITECCSWVPRARKNKVGRI